MASWIYVLELSPPGFVKVGQTTQLPNRLNDHIRVVGMSGAAVTRVFSVACAGAELLERQILKRVADLPGAVAVNGREIYAGVTFLEVATIADREAGARYRKVRPVQNLGNDELRDLLEDVDEALGADDVVRATDVAARLRELAPRYQPYQRMDGQRLAERLSVEGVDVRRKNGYPVVRADRVHQALTLRQRPLRSGGNGDDVLGLVEEAPA